MVSIFLKIIIKQLIKNKCEEFDLEEYRLNILKNTAPLKVSKGIQIQSLIMNGVGAEKLFHNHKSNTLSTPTVPSAPSDPSLIFLYFHGGAYISGSCDTSRAFVSFLCKKLNVDAYSVNYRLAPEHPYPAALEDALAAYKWLLEEQSLSSDNIIIAGDSAGGGLALALLLRIRNQNLPLPKAAICFSPWTDLTLSSETMTSRVLEDPMLTTISLENGSRMYTGKNNPSNPEISPIFANLSGLPPIFLQVGTREILLDDSLQFAKLLKNAGSPVVLDVWEGLFHIFLIMATIPFIGRFIPECRRAIKNVKEFIDKLN